MYRDRVRRALGALTLTAAGLATLLGVVLFVLGYRLSPVLTGSMSPTFRPGDAIVTRAAGVTGLRPGMVPVIVPPGQNAPFAHRLVTVTGTPDHPVVTTKGDANPAADRWRVRLGGPTVPVVVATVPRLGTLLLFIHGRVSAVLLTVLGLVTTGVGLRICTTNLGGHPRPRHAI